MLLRRMTKHVKDQNWFAVLLDFFIVVAGVYIGIQLGNWNEANAEREEYTMALGRYQSEIQENFTRIDDMAGHSQRTLKLIEQSYDALLSCKDTPENRELVNTGINGMMGTLGLKVQTNALDELTSNSTLLAQQTDADRRQFGKTRFLLSVFLREADFLETIPLQERAQNNPVLKVGPKNVRNVSYAGEDFSRVVRLLELDAPIDVACKNDALIKSFYTWERWQGALTPTMRIIRDQLESDLEYIGE